MELRLASGGIRLMGIDGEGEYGGSNLMLVPPSESRGKEDNKS